MGVNGTYHQEENGAIASQSFSPMHPEAPHASPVSGPFAWAAGMNRRTALTKTIGAVAFTTRPMVALDRGA
jgi:hypothetical protein